MPVKILDAGGRYMISGPVREEVDAALQEQLKRGAKQIGAIQQLGSSWVAACSIPKGTTADDTQTLRLADFQKPVADSPEDIDPDIDDGCTVQEFGFKRIISGPTKQAVELRIQHFKKFGADIVAAPEDVGGGNWEAVVDVGGADKAFRY